MAVRHATLEGTASYRERFREEVHPSHFGLHNNLWFSSIGIGIYVNSVDAAVISRFRDTLSDALLSGCNYVDTTITHRGRSGEQVVGQVLASAFAMGLVAREQVVVGTRGGTIVFEGEYPTDAARYVHRNLIEAGVAAADEFAQGWHHCMSPRYLRSQFRQSLTYLGLGTLDIYFIHNPEVQRLERGPEVFEGRLRAAFAELEAQYHAERLVHYGIATTDGFRVPIGDPAYLSLERVVELARDAGGENHRFRYVQAPMNLTMREISEFKNQVVGGREMTLLEAAQELGVIVFGASALWDGELATQLPDSILAAFPNASTSAQAALQYARSVPGLATAVAAMSKQAHIEENLAVTKWPLAPAATLSSLFG